MFSEENLSFAAAQTFTVDNTSPTTSSDTESGFYKNDFTVTLTADEPAQVSYKIDDGNTTIAASPASIKRNYRRGIYNYLLFYRRRW